MKRAVVYSEGVGLIAGLAHLPPAERPFAWLGSGPLRPSDAAGGLLAHLPATGPGRNAAVQLQILKARCASRQPLLRTNVATPAASPSSTVSVCWLLPAVHCHLWSAGHRQPLCALGVKASVASLQAQESLVQQEAMLTAGFDSVTAELRRHAAAAEGPPGAGAWQAPGVLGRLDALRTLLLQADGCIPCSLF